MSYNIWGCARGWASVGPAAYQPPAAALGVAAMRQKLFQGDGHCDT